MPYLWSAQAHSICLPGTQDDMPWDVLQPEAQANTKTLQANVLSTVTPLTAHLCATLPCARPGWHRPW